MRYRLNPEEVRAALAAPFPASAVDWRPGKVVEKQGRPPAALAMAYIDAREVVDRLTSVVGIDAWQSDHVSIGEKQIACRIGIQFGDGWVWKSDGTYVGDLDFRQGENPNKEEGRVEMEGKGSFSVALKRAAVHWGIGRYLYDIGAVWADVEKRGHSWAFSDAGLRKLDGIADRLYREANQGKAGRMPVREPVDDDRAPAQRQPEPPRAAPADRPVVPPSQVRAAADHAVASQVRGTPADVPTFDPAHVALCEDFERRAHELNGGDPNPLYNAIDAAKLPEALAKRAFFACFVAAFRGAPSLKTLDEWVDFAAQIKWGPQYAPLLKEESDRADARLAPAAA